MKKAEVKPDEELATVETLEQITHEWLEQQSIKFEKPTQTSHKKRISDYYVVNRFKKTMCKKLGFEDILYIFGICISKIICSLLKALKYLIIIFGICISRIICSLMKALKYLIVRSTEFILKVERH